MCIDGFSIENWPPITPKVQYAMHACRYQSIALTTWPETMEMCPATSDRITDLAAILAVHITIK